MCWLCISRGRCCVVSGAPGEQPLAPVTSTNTSSRQQGPAPAPQPPTPPVTCPYTVQGDFVSSWWKNDSYCRYNIWKSQEQPVGFSCCHLFLILYFALPLPLAVCYSVTIFQSRHALCFHMQFSSYSAENPTKINQLVFLFLNYIGLLRKVQLQCSFEGKEESVLVVVYILSVYSSDPGRNALTRQSAAGSVSKKTETYVNVTWNPIHRWL